MYQLWKLYGTTIEPLWNHQGPPGTTRGNYETIMKAVRNHYETIMEPLTHKNDGNNVDNNIPRLATEGCDRRVQKRMKIESLELSSRKLKPVLRGLLMVSRRQLPIAHSLILGKIVQEVYL